MIRSRFLVPAFVALVGAIVIGAPDPAKDKEPKAAAPPEFQLPPGWTAEDMQAMMAAGTPGEMHKLMAKDVGTWAGKNTMWMAPGTEPMKSESTAKITSIMDGRYLRMEFSGDMAGMGPFSGMGISGYDNVSKRFVSTWIDNQSTGIMTGTGELSKDGKVLTWNFSYNCPITKKATVMREIDTITGPDTKTLEMWGVDPKSGKEYKMMLIELTRKK